MKLDETLLRDVGPFRNMPLDQIRKALDQARPRRFEPHQVVFEEGDSADWFFLLLDGHIQVERINRDGDRVVSLYIPPGQLFGLAAALGRDAYPATAVAAVECLVLIWPTSQWGAYSTEFPGFAAETYKTVGNRVHEMHDRVMDLSTRHVEQRVASALLRLMQQNGRPSDVGVEIAFPVTRRLISEMTGSTLHTVSRLLSNWEREQIIRSRRKHINVLDADRLEALTK
jgi:CRP-like cAMP-binding protein